jgi:hypothetical protein
LRLIRASTSQQNRCFEQGYMDLWSMAKGALYAYTDIQY